MLHRSIHSGHVLGVAALLAPSLGVLGPNLITPLTLFAMLGLLCLRAANRDAAVRIDRPLLVIVSLLLCWSALSLIWTIKPADAAPKFVTVAAFGLMVAATLMFSPPMVEHQRHTLRRFIIAGTGFGLMILLIEMSTAGWISQSILGKVSIHGSTKGMFGPASSVVLLLIWPSVAILWRSMPAAALGLIGMGFFASYILPGTSAAIAYSIGTVFFFAALLAHRGAAWFLASAVALGILIAPFVPQIAPALDPSTIRAQSSSNNASLLHRLDIWALTISKVGDRPLIGWGFNASRNVPEGDAHYYLRNRSGTVVGQGNRLPLHPHNGSLQAWLELGLPGALGFAALFALTALRTGRQTEPASAAAALGAVGAAVPIWLLSFGIWQSWWMSVLTLTVLLFVSMIESEKP